MTTKVDVFNMALGYLGVSIAVSDPNQDTPAAGACRMMYDAARQAELRMFPWSFATAAAALALVSDTDKFGYGYVYQRPVDALRIYGVMPETGVRTWIGAPCRQWMDASPALPQIPYKEMGAQILTDLDGAYMAYVKDVPEVQMTDALFVDVLSLSLAVRIAPRVMGTQAGQGAARMVSQMLANARGEAWAQALNEQGQDYRPSRPRSKRGTDVPQLLQPSFSGGEISPKLWGRVDLQRYASSVATARNVLVLPEGGLQNRAGTRYLAKTGDGLPDERPVRVIPFRFAADQAYCVELGERYARFFANGAPVLAPSPPAWSGAVTYANKAFVTYLGVTYKSKQAGNLNHTPTAVSAWWVPQTALEIETPWIGSHAMELRFTQSADVMTLTHIRYKPHQLRRTAADVFSVVPFDHREGPFTLLNADDAVVVSASARSGVVTVSANKDIFNADMIGQLLYMEIRDLSQIKPWVPGERTPNLAVGARRRSDGKTYQAVTVPTSGGLEWTETGTRAPVHDSGRAWDGPGDSRDNGSVQWITGVEWEYRDSGYGVVEITAFTDARTVTAEVRRTLPDQVVGGVGTPGATWNLVGDGTTKVFALAGATGSNYDYSVTISGVPVASDPPYSGGGGGSGGPGGDLP